jgi:hypothetical protein
MSQANPASSRPAIDLEVDVARKILRMHYRGVVTAKELRAQRDAIRVSLAKLGPGFSLVTDLSDLQEMDIDTVDDITRFMDLCLAAGVKQIIRVIPDPDKDIGFHLLSMTHYRGRVPITTHETLAEAERALGAGA